MGNHRVLLCDKIIIFPLKNFKNNYHNNNNKIIKIICACNKCMGLLVYILFINTIQIFYLVSLFFFLTRVFNSPNKNERKTTKEIYVYKWKKKWSIKQKIK